MEDDMEPFVNGFFSYLIENMSRWPNLPREDALRQAAQNWKNLSLMEKQKYRTKMEKRRIRNDHKCINRRHKRQPEKPKPPCARTSPHGSCPSSHRMKRIKRCPRSCRSQRSKSSCKLKRDNSMATDVKFNASLSCSDPQSHPVLIIGQLRHLNLLKFSHLESKLSPRVTEETFSHAVACLHPAPTDRVSLYLDMATLAALPLKASRHNTTSRAHAITRLVKNHVLNVAEESVVLVCERENLFASACAVVRAFPLYSRKTGNLAAAQVKKEFGCGGDGDGDSNTDAGRNVVNVEFLLINKEGNVDCEPLTEDELLCLNETARGIRLTARIVDMPCNEMNVDHFIQAVEEVGKDLCLKPQVIRGEELRERGFGGIYGVGKAAAVPPALVVLSHLPKGAQETIALVGKGIVYDTGGLSIKAKTGMPGMKRDCGGAAAILGAFYAAVKCGFKDNLHAVFCLAENSVGPNATRPDDIHTLYSGRTVEINNTDAEGRLVLADGVCFANKDLKANIILDMATLTGAQGVATGKYHGAVLTNSETWEAKSLQAGRKSGDLLAPIIYCPELHFSEFASAIADMKNSVADRQNAQSSCAGLFIAAHLGFDYPGIWMHVDMATPVHCGERATGYGVALLLTLFGGHTKSELLQSIAPTDEEPPSKRLCRD
ncbi:probable aminopeptidase NPEPL1 isoform X2 [Drosophila rhopaloa]|uniref:Cytosol aminopeptidase domain-containing protein n=1 Tax=Drosophila rhopaloa TaxID=1041015 RepID=A0ABM5J7P4_DRORH|nr:probable aminopeptidase NPEPL1 isoform X2 [Drosophila rhopaloa]